MSSDVNVVCPKCEQQEIYSYTGPLQVKVTCSKCSTEFSFILATTRAKRSRGNRKDNRREFDIRVYLNDGDEELIQFVKSGYDDIELKAKDGVVFSFLGDKIRIVQNIKIGKYTSISEPSCYIATYVYGAYSEEVSYLRKWRDTVLISSVQGRLVIKWYYSISPVLLRCFCNNELFTKSSRTLIYLLLNVLGYKAHNNSLARDAGVKPPASHSLVVRKMAKNWVRTQFRLILVKYVFCPRFSSNDRRGLAFSTSSSNASVDDALGKVKRGLKSKTCHT